MGKVSDFQLVNSISTSNYYHPGKLLLLIYTTLISTDLAQYEIFDAKVCNFWQGWYNISTKLYLVPALNFISNTCHRLLKKTPCPPEDRTGDPSI